MSQSLRMCCFCRETLKYSEFVAKILNNASGGKYFGAFKFGAEALFYGCLLADVYQNPYLNDWVIISNQFYHKKCPEIIRIFAPVCLMYACCALVWTQCPSDWLDCLEPQAFRCDFAQNIVNTCASAGVHFAEQPRAGVVKQHKVCSVVSVDTAHTCAGAARCFFLLAWTTQSAVMSTETIGSNHFSCLPKKHLQCFH